MNIIQKRQKMEIITLTKEVIKSYFIRQSVGDFLKEKNFDINNPEEYYSIDRWLRRELEKNAGK